MPVARVVSPAGMPLLNHRQECRYSITGKNAGGTDVNK